MLMRKTKRLKYLFICFLFLLLLVFFFKGRHGSEGVKCGLNSLCGLFQLSRQLKVKLQDAVHNYTGKGVSGRDKALEATQQLVCI